MQGWPGEKLGISMQAIDELGNPTGSIARSSFRFLPNSDQMVRTILEGFISFQDGLKLLNSNVLLNNLKVGHNVFVIGFVRNFGVFAKSHLL